MSSFERHSQPTREVAQSPVSPYTFVNQAEEIVKAHRPPGLPEEYQPTNMESPYAPYSFTQEDLQLDRLMPGVEYSLKQFYRWRDSNSTGTDDYISRCIDQLAISRDMHSKSARVRRLIVPGARQEFRQERALQELAVFGVRNMVTAFDKKTLLRFRQHLGSYQIPLKETAHPTGSAMNILAGMFLLDENGSEIEILRQRLKRVHQILPEQVIREGAMGKVARTILGVGAIARFDTMDASDEERRAHLTRVAFGAVSYGAVYAIIDDTLQDANIQYISERDKEQYREAVLQGLRTGKSIDASDLPDSPLADEVRILYDIFITYYPIDEYPHLYHAAESMYTAQDRDANRSHEESSGHLTDLYPDLVIKSGMSRVIANILARQNLDSEFYRRCVNSMFANQFRDDFVDYDEDLQAKRVTPFTYPYPSDTNPLFDMFAYDAYIAATLNHSAIDTLAYSQVNFLSHYLVTHPERVVALLQTYGDTIPASLRTFINEASSLPGKTARRLIPVDQKLKKAISEATTHRPATDVDPQIFVLDRIEAINDLIGQFIEGNERAESENELHEIMKYALEAGGKRLRPALTLMLAESLQVDQTAITPLLLANELFHTASLLFDDLPWQDNSDTRRGKPTAHTVFDPASVELAGVSMILEGISVLQQLKNLYAAADVSAITTYINTAIQSMCLGQNMDLQMTRASREDITLDKVLEMYHLKTAVAMEASLVPLMMLEKRTQTEIALIKEYAHHAGLVFQIKDDLLDVSSSVDDLGKNVQQDLGKINVVQLYGVDKAEELMNRHLGAAISACRSLPFNTNLLQGIVTYFAKRKK